LTSLLISLCSDCDSFYLPHSVGQTYQNIKTPNKCRSSFDWVMQFDGSLKLCWRWLVEKPVVIVWPCACTRWPFHPVDC